MGGAASHIHLARLFTDHPHPRCGATSPVKGEVGKGGGCPKSPLPRREIPSHLGGGEKQKSPPPLRVARRSVPSPLDGGGLAPKFPPPSAGGKKVYPLPHRRGRVRVGGAASHIHLARQFTDHPHPRCGATSPVEGGGEKGGRAAGAVLGEGGKEGGRDLPCYFGGGRLTPSPSPIRGGQEGLSPPPSRGRVSPKSPLPPRRGGGENKIPSPLGGGGLGWGAASPYGAQSGYNPSWIPSLVADNCARTLPMQNEECGPYSADVRLTATNFDSNHLWGRTSSTLSAIPDASSSRSTEGSIRNKHRKTPLARHG